MRAVAASLVVALGLLGCGPGRWDLRVDAELRSILVVQFTQDQIHATAAPLEDAALQIPAAATFGQGPGDRIVVLGYRATLAELGFSAGALVLDPDGEPLPAADAKWIGVAGGAGLLPERGIADPSLEAVHVLRRGPAEVCLARESCFGLDDATCGERCEVDAVEPQLAPPAAPSLLPCPLGWAQRSDDLALGPRCEPWPGEAPDTCPAGAVIFPGELACHPLGEACPSGAFAAGLGPGVIFVDPAAGPGGNGDRSAPFSTIAAAILRGSRGATIALAKGSYDEAALLPYAALLRGACAAETVLRAPAGAVGLDLAAGGSVVGLRVEGGRIGLRLSGSGTIEGVALSGASDLGLLVRAGAIVMARGLSIDSAGVGAQVRDGLLDASRIELRRAARYGLQAISGELRLADAAIRGVSEVDGIAAGINVEPGVLRVERAVVEHVPLHGIEVVHGSALGSDLVLRDIDGGAPATAGLWLGAGTATITRAYVARVGHAGFRVTNGSRLHGTDLLVRDMLSDGQSLSAAVYVDSSDVHLARLRVQTLGSGVQTGNVDGPTTATVTDAHFIAAGPSGTNDAAIYCIGERTRCFLDRVVSQEWANGVRCERAELRAHDLRVQGARAPGTTFVLGGRAVAMLNGARGVFDNAIFERAPVAAVTLGSDSRFEGHDIRIGDLSPCEGAACELRTGSGYRVGIGSSLFLRRFAVHKVSGIGVDLGGSGAIDIADGEFIEDEVAVSVPASFDRALLLRHVRYRGNRVTWQTSSE